jgi:hypothetical protein
LRFVVQLCNCSLAPVTAPNAVVFVDVCGGPLTRARLAGLLDDRRQEGLQ